MDLVSLYVHQVKENDLSRDRAARFPSMKLYPTVADALTLGEDGLAGEEVFGLGVGGGGPEGRFPVVAVAEVAVLLGVLAIEVVGGLEGEGRAGHGLANATHFRNADFRWAFSFFGFKKTGSEIVPAGSTA